MKSKLTAKQVEQVAKDMYKTLLPIGAKAMHVPLKSLAPWARYEYQSVWRAIIRYCAARGFDPDARVE